MRKPVIESYWPSRQAHRLKIILVASALFIIAGLLTQNGEFVFVGAMMLICIGTVAALMIGVPLIFRRIRLKGR